MISKESLYSNNAARNGDLDGRPQATGLIGLFHRHPVISALVIFALDWVVAALAGIAGTAFAPAILKTAGGPGLADFIAVCITILPIVALTTFLGWWRLIGYNRPAEWRDLWLLLLPVVAILLPLVAGVKAIDAGTLVFLLVGYLLTGFYEETLFRGVILRILQPKGVWTAILLSSLLFGLAHSTNIFLRLSGNPGLLGLQIVGAFTHGVGLAALRLRTNTLWPLILLHAFGDLFLHLGNLPVPLMDAAVDTILLIYGIVLILRMRRMKPQAHVGPAAVQAVD
jgi:membrane protease YdiL (CAAX protease family)